MLISGLFLILFSSLAFIVGKKFVISQRQPHTILSAQPSFYGWCAASWMILATIAYGLFFFLVPSLRHLLSAHLILGLGFLSSLIASVLFLKPKFHARKHIESIMHKLLIFSAFISIATTILIVLSVLIESIRFFQHVPLTQFLFGLEWSPQTALRPDQAGSSGSFGAIPVFVGTFLITLIAMSIAVPLGLYSAMYLSEFASKRIRKVIKPMIEILAGIPTVIYGFVAVTTVAPLLREFGVLIGLDIASESALVAGSVMGVMIIPFILSLSDDVMHAVPKSLRDASFALGATKVETVTKVVFPAALPGIMGAVLLGVSRAIGETMIVVMAAGLSANLTVNPLHAVTTVTAQIVTLLIGDQEFDSSKTLAAFALGLTLFILTLTLNVIAVSIVKRFREQYE